MKKQYFWACMLMAPAALVSCSDINLGDLNTDVAVQVRDFTVPIQMDEVKLSTMLDIEDDSQIKVVNGEYAVVVEGSFESATIEVDPIVVPGSKAETNGEKVSKSRPQGSNTDTALKTKRRAAGHTAVAEYSLSQVKMAIAANADEIHDAIKKLSEIKVNTSFEYTLSLGQYGSLFDKVNKLHIENFAIKAPKGIIFGYLRLTTEGGTKKYEARYDSETGLVTFDSEDIVSSDGKLHIEGEVSGFNSHLLEDALKDFTASSRGRKGANTENSESSSSKSFSYNEEVGVESGGVVIYDDDFKNQDQTTDEMYDSLDDDMGFSAETSMDEITINSVSGSFNYDVADVDLEAVNLSDIPDMLSESGTDIRLDNPQIYLYLHNSVIDGDGKAVGASAKVAITANDDNKDQSHHYEIDESINVDEAENYIYLSPHEVSNDEKYKDEGSGLDFTDAEHVTFSDLGNVLSGPSDEGGIPTSLDINTFDTHVSAEDVHDLALGQKYGLEGSYVFVAPLALSEDSRIKYTDTIDGWAEDTEGIVVSKLVLNASATTDVPFELLLRVTPINARGERLGTATDLVLPANAKNAPIELTLSGDIHDLDGIKLDVTAVAKEVRTLAPDMNISLSGIKVKVSGQYETEF